MVYGRISISIDLFYMIIYRICLSLAAQPSIIHSVKEKVIKCQVMCSSSLVLPAAGLLMEHLAPGPDGPRQDGSICTASPPGPHILWKMLRISSDSQ